MTKKKSQSVEGRREYFNFKRKIIPIAEGVSRCEELAVLASRARYGGNPEHKIAPGDFNLTPPSCAKAHKTLCDNAGIFKISVAQGYLRSGFCHGMISLRQDGEWPQNVWAVMDNGIALEAQLENPVLGVYHGYPMPDNDPFREEIIRRWHASHECCS